MNKFGKIGNCAHRGGQEGALEAPRVDDGKHAFSMIGVHVIEATILWRGGFGGRGGARWTGGVAGFGPICHFVEMFSVLFCLSFIPWFLVCISLPFGCHMDAKEVQKRPQGHPFGQQKLTKLALDQRCQDVAPVQ